VLNDTQHLNDPDQLTPQQRCDEVAAILADGLLRARRRRHLDPLSLVPERADSAATGLEVPGELPLHGPDGLAPARATKPEGSDQ
jgi:hypothetical protein